MNQTITSPQSLPKLTPPTELEVVAYLRQSCQWSEILASIEEEATILALCQQFGLEITDEELQAAGDAFRLKHNLLGIIETQTWLRQQKITLEEWSEGIRRKLLLRKLQEHLFGANIDAYYISNRERYRRVALSQILVRDLEQAHQIVQLLQDPHCSFCALAIEYSLGKKSRSSGGFMGVVYLSEIAPVLAQEIINTPSAAIVGPVAVGNNYHIVKIEKRFPLELNQSVREQILQSLWEIWYQRRY